MTFWLNNTDKLPQRPFNAENQLKCRVQKSQIKVTDYLPILSITPRFKEICPLSQEEISQNSQLTILTTSPFPNLYNFPTSYPLEERWLHLLANFLGSGLITGGKDKLSYEGFPFFLILRSGNISFSKCIAV